MTNFKFQTIPNFQILKSPQDHPRPYQGERIKVRGGPNLSTLTHTLSHQGERGLFQCESHLWFGTCRQGGYLDIK